jgi:hypothetical protein
MQEWYGARDTGLRDKAMTMLQKEPLREWGSGRNTGATGMQQWHKGSRHNLVVMSEEGNNNWTRHQRMELKKAIMSGEQNIQQDHKAEFQTGDHEASSRDFQWVTKNE